MAKHLAITIAGAVSLGSYEAGVLYELLEAIRTHNEQETVSENDKIYVDVITGASAGGMTAAMVAQRLLYDGKALQCEFTNALYQAWVQNISLMQLVKMGWKQKKWHSLLSSDLVKSIGEKMLIHSMKGSLSGPHAAVEQIDGVLQTIRVGLALTNLNGIDYMIPILGNSDGGFNYTTSVDQMTFDVTGDKEKDSPGWQKMCAAAVASGAFPAAFRPEPISRSMDEFGVRLPNKVSAADQGKTFVDWSGRSPAEFAYSDGGVLQNQPLGVAKNLVDFAVADRVRRCGASAFRDAGDRLYVFIAPHSVKSTAEKLEAQKITIWNELKQLVHVYLRQAMFHDWIVAEGINQDIRELDNRASGLAKVIAEGSIDIPALLKASSDLNSVLIESRSEEQDRQNRLREQYNTEYSSLLESHGPEAATAFVSALATLEAAAYLESRDKMKIVAVIADPQKELAGSGLSSFVGFFRESFREHDYWVGRVKTRDYLMRADVRHILGVESWPKQNSWTPQLPNPSGIELPLGFFQVASAAVIPTLIMIVIRPLLLLVLAVTCVLGFAGIHRFASLVFEWVKLHH
jgi:predicted acylesterase/phospholipase RssA